MPRTRASAKRASAAKSAAAAPVKRASAKRASAKKSLAKVPAGFHDWIAFLDKEPTKKGETVAEKAKRLSPKFRAAHPDVDRSKRGSAKTKAERKRAAVHRASGSKRERLTVDEARAAKVRRVRGLDILSRNSPYSVFAKKNWKKPAANASSAAKRAHFRTESKRIGALWQKSTAKKDADAARKAAKAKAARK